MRESEFPFAKFRDWGEIPKEKPELDVEKLLSFAHWQARTYRRPINDDITGYYNFYPSKNGATSYATRASARLFAGKTALSEGITEAELQGKKERQPIHIAESAESAIAVFWTVSQLRQSVLSEALSCLSDGKEIPEEVSVYAADAIADFGYCLLHPVDIDHRGVDHGSELAKEIERNTGGAHEQLESFGLYAANDPDLLKSYEGVAALEITLEEQIRRNNYWSPRHQAILEAFPSITPSNEILYMRLPLKELLSIEFPRVSPNSV